MPEICSKCHKTFLQCKCDQFHPNITESFILTDFEQEALLDYFYKYAGYINPDLEIVNNFIKRLKDYDSSRID